MPIDIRFLLEYRSGAGNVKGDATHLWNSGAIIASEYARRSWAEAFWNANKVLMKFPRPVFDTRRRTACWAAAEFSRGRREAKESD
jgi:hypothetical protein